MSVTSISYDDLRMWISERPEQHAPTMSEWNQEGTFEYSWSRVLYILTVTSSSAIDRFCWNLILILLECTDLTLTSQQPNHDQCSGCQWIIKTFLAIMFVEPWRRVASKLPCLSLLIIEARGHSTFHFHPHSFKLAVSFTYHYSPKSAPRSHRHCARTKPGTPGVLYRADLSVPHLEPDLRSPILETLPLPSNY